MVSSNDKSEQRFTGLYRTSSVVGLARGGCWVLECLGNPRTILVRYLWLLQEADTSAVNQLQSSAWCSKDDRLNHACNSCYWFCRKQFCFSLFTKKRFFFLLAIWQMFHREQPRDGFRYDVLWPSLVCLPFQWGSRSPTGGRTALARPRLQGTSFCHLFELTVRCS